MYGVLVLLGIVLLLFWLMVTLRLISMKDEEFEGRNDKLIWFIFVFFGSAPGAFIFCVWRLRKAMGDQASRETERLLQASMAEVLRQHKQAPDKP